MNTSLRRSGMARVLKGSQFSLPTTCSSANGMNHTCLFLPAKAGIHLPTPEKWKAELAWVYTNMEPCLFPPPFTFPFSQLPLPSLPSHHSIFLLLCPFPVVEDSLLGVQ